MLFDYLSGKHFCLYIICSVFLHLINPQFGTSQQDSILFSPYQASRLLNEGSVEVKLFNSLYTQTAFDGFDLPNSRSTFLSSFLQFLSGTKNQNINWGFDVIYRSNVIDDFADASPFKALQFKYGSQAAIAKDGHQLTDSDGNPFTTYFRHGFSHIGPKIKFHPIRKWRNITLQQTVYIPLQSDLGGDYISFTQLFFDWRLNSHWYLFLDAQLWMPIYPDVAPNPNLKAFLSYVPNRKWIIYGTSTLPKEFGLGVKYNITPNLEIEGLYTYYLPIDLFVGFVRPETFNFGFRYTSF